MAGLSRRQFSYICCTCAVSLLVFRPPFWTLDVIETGISNASAVGFDLSRLPVESVLLVWYYWTWRTMHLNKRETVLFHTSSHNLLSSQLHKYVPLGTSFGSEPCADGELTTVGRSSPRLNRTSRSADDASKHTKQNINRQKRINIFTVELFLFVCFFENLRPASY